MDFSPKSNFAKGPHAASWAEIAASTMFREAGSAAMLDMQAKFPYTLQAGDAAANHWRMEGARQFFAILMHLTTPPEEKAAVPKTHNLDHSL